MKKIITNLPSALTLFGIFFISVVSLSAQSTIVTNDRSERKDGQPPVLNATCGDLGAENNSWGPWIAEEGYHPFGSVPVFFAPMTNPTSPRFTIVTGGAIDQCSVGSTGPLLPVVAPGFGNFSIRLGEPVRDGLSDRCTNTSPYPPPSGGASGNGCSERLHCSFTVGINDTNFLYAYAIILENPNPTTNSHTLIEAPFAEIYILAPKTGGGVDTVPCSHRKYTANVNGQTTPGFYTGTCVNQGGSDVVSYKPWTTVGVNLTQYVAKTLTVVITNTDCGKGGHFCHSYWDFACPPISGNDPPFCLGSQVTLVGPSSDPSNPYTYEWYVNGKPYGSPIATSISIVPTPKIGDVYAVLVHQNSKCNFWVPFTPKPLRITSNFTAVGGCGGTKVNFTDKSTTPDNSAIVKWDWNFGGGIPNTSQAQNPTGILYTKPGTYSVTLISTSKGGCVDSITLTVTIAPIPVAAFNSNIVCFNNPTTFLDSSYGTPTPTKWDWNFGDGNSSVSKDPKHLYGAPGSYTVILIATDPNGCKDTIKHQVYINPLPEAKFVSNEVCFGNTTCFNNLSSISPGKIIKMSWIFGDPASGNLNVDSVPAPCHKYNAIKNYSVTLTVTSDSGCQSTIVHPVTFSPPPVALFASTPVCLNDPTSFTSSSTSSTTDPIKIWDWSFGDGIKSNLPNPTHIYAAGTFTATLIVTTVGGCKDTIDKPIVVHAPPVANFLKPDSGCAPLRVGYTDLSTSSDGTVSSWKWSFPGGSPLTSTIKDPQNINYTVPGTYSVSLIITTTFGCQDTIQLPMIKVFPWPKAEFSVSPTIAPATDPVFKFLEMWQPSNLPKWSWNFGDNTPFDSMTANPVHSYSASVNQNDFYTKQICLSVKNEHGCWDNVCHEVKLIPEFTFYIPNTFTPNADSINDMFFGKCRGVKEYDIWLFDRWGNQIWDCHHDDKNTNWDNDATSPRQDGLASYCKWDGKVVQGGLDMGGNSRIYAQQDVYVWKVKLLDIFNKRHTYIGHVNIVK
jgi:PKD repeat protein